MGKCKQRGQSAGPASAVVQHEERAQSSAPAATRFPWKPALAVFLVALAFRAAYLFSASRAPAFDALNMDPLYNIDWARCLATGQWSDPYTRLQHAAFFRAPLFSYSAAGLFMAFGQSLSLLRGVQILMGSGSCVLAFLLARKCFDTRTGVLTGLVCAVYWVLIYFDSTFLLTVPLVFLGLLGFLFLFMALERQSPWWAGAGGLMLGLFGITRADILPFYPVACLWALVAARHLPRPRRLLLVALLAAGCLLPPALTTVRNRVVSGDWVVVASQGGVNFYIGNNPESNGMQAVVPGTRPTWWGGYDDTVAIAEKAAGRRLKASEVSRYWFDRSFAYIRQQPGHWLRLTARKAAAFVGGVEIPNNEPYENRQRDFLSLRLPLNFGILFALFLVALPRMLRRAPAAPTAGAPADLRPRFNMLILLFVATYSATLIAFFVTGRYRVPLIPFVALGAAAAVFQFVDWVRARQFARAAALGGLAIGLAALLSLDWTGTRKATEGWGKFTEAQSKMSVGNPDAAIALMEEVHAGGTLPLEEVYASLARAYVMRGRPQDRPRILALAQDGLARFPDATELLWYAATVNMERRHWKEALDYATRYLVKSPGNLDGLKVAFFASLFDGRREEAARFLAQAEQIDPRAPVVVEMRRQLALRP